MTKHARCRFTLVAAILSGSALAQSSLPTPSRTVFKCEINGRIMYSDSPCMGAEKLEIEPTRGLNSTSGKKREGKDVRHERLQEGIAEAWRPITGGKDARQLETESRRFKLLPEAQRECRRLDLAIPHAEAQEKGAPKQARSEVQHTLLDLRKRFRELGC